jgi:hypothetical protein
MLLWLLKKTGYGHSVELIPRDAGSTLPVHRIAPFPRQRVERKSKAEVLVRKFDQEVMILQLPEGNGKSEHVMCFLHPTTQYLVFSSFGAGCAVDLNNVSNRFALPNEAIWDAYDRETLTLVLMTNEQCCLLRHDGRFQLVRKMSEGGIDDCRIENGIVKATGWDRLRRTVYPFEVRLSDSVFGGTVDARRRGG